MFELLLDRLSQLDHIKTTPTWFNFKPVLSKETDQEVFFLSISSFFIGQPGCFWIDQGNWVMLRQLSHNLILNPHQTRSWAKFFHANFIIFQLASLEVVQCLMVYKEVFTLGVIMAPSCCFIGTLHKIIKRQQNTENVRVK